MNTTKSQQRTSLFFGTQIRHFLDGLGFPRTGKEVVETARRNGAPEHLLHALQQLTPAKNFHNTYEVWFDVMHRQRSRA
jgi:hypothetical protein